MKNIFLLLLIIIVLLKSAEAQTSRKIAYVSDDNTSGVFQVFTMDENGENKKQISSMSTDCFFPRWSPDGSKIAFNTDDSRIFVIDNANSETPDDPRYLFSGEHPSYSMDGEFIVFNSDFEGVLTIYAMEQYTSEPFIISSLGYSNQQVLSKDGSKIVFSSFYNGGKEIILIDLDDTTENNLYKISDNNNANLLPDISSDNMLVIWASFNQNLQGTIHIYKAAKETALTKGIESANLPKFSPDDSKIGFVSISGSSVKLYTMNTDGSNKQSYNVNGGSVANYRWMDDERILYDAEDGNHYTVGILNIKSGKSEALTGKGSSMHPDAQN